MRNKRSGEALAALSRRAPTMKHRLEPKGGSQKYDWDLEAGPTPEDLVAAVTEWRDAPCDSEECDGDNHMENCTMFAKLADVLAIHNKLTDTEDE